jgi:hypothetical protein
METIELETKTNKQKIVYQRIKIQNLSIDQQAKSEQMLHDEKELKIHTTKIINFKIKIHLK